MRSPNSDEKRLIRQSRKRRRRDLIAQSAAALLIVGILSFAGYFARQASQRAVEGQKKLAQEQLRTQMQTAQTETQKLEAEKQAKMKRAVRLAREAKEAMYDRYDLAALLSAAAWQAAPTTFEARDAIYSVFQARPDVITVLHPVHPTTYSLGTLVFSHDGKQQSSCLPQMIIRSNSGMPQQ